MIHGFRRPPPNRQSARPEVVKTNLCRLPPPLALTIEGENVAVPTLRYSAFVEPPRPPSHAGLCARRLLD